MSGLSKRVVLFGSGGFAEVAWVYLTNDSPYEVAAFSVHGEYLTQDKLMGLAVVPFEDIREKFPPDDFAMFVAIAFKRLNRARQDVYTQCKDKGYQLISYVNSRAVHWDSLDLGDNCFIFEANVIQPFVKIGNNVIMWSGNHIGHHSHIGDHCFIASHAVISGNCRIGPGCFIGVNSTLRDGITIGDNCVIGAGALILRDAAANSVYRGAETTPSRVSSDKLISL
jgi:sugar O-acyltransferase (sialic acid O-acetyltransferase NeuD family)